MNHYEIFFTYEGQVLKLPQNPETLPVELEGENQAYNVLGIGPITVPREPKQKRIRIEGLFPGENDTPPETYIKFFQDAMYEQRIIVYTPVRAYETGTPFNGGDDGFQCLVENFSTEERGGETGDFYYSVEIVEYRDYSPKIVEVRPVQTGYAMSTSNNRTSEGVQVGSEVEVSGNVYNYPTNQNSVNTAYRTHAFVERKENRNGKEWMQVKMDNLVKGNVRENQGKVSGPSVQRGYVESSAVTTPKDFSGLVGGSEARLDAPYNGPQKKTPYSILGDFIRDTNWDEFDSPVPVY